MRLAHTLYNTSQSHPARTSLLCGVLSVLALPPVSLWPVLFITFPLFLVTLSQTLVPKQGFVRGFLFAFGYHVAGLYWIAHSMLVDAAKFWWAVPLAVAALPAYFALYAGLVCATLIVLRNRLQLTTTGTALLFVPLYMLAEIARSRFFTGFEWNLLASVWAGDNGALPMLQTLSLVGAYGLSALTLLLVTTPLLIASGARRLGISIIAGMATLFAWGTVHVYTHPTTYTPNVQLRLVQPNIPQELKWNAEARDDNFDTLLKLSDSSAGLLPTHIIWPEAAAPYVLNKDEQARLQTALRAPTNGLVITGSIWRDDLPDGVKRYTNSAMAIDSVGAISGRFDKFHLVPFGEYFPARAWLASHGINVNSIAAGNKDFMAGSGARTLTLKNLPPVSPLICYEVVYSGAVVDEANRPAWLLNLTNDAWFGTTSGPYQHFAAARMRAIEEGLPLVRVANTGISGVIDAHGRITAQTRLNTTTVLDHGLPEAAPLTPFSRHGHALFIFIIAFIGAGALTFRRK